VTADELLAANSPPSTMEHLLHTPHTEGDARQREDNVLSILWDNLLIERRNQIAEPLCCARPRARTYSLGTALLRHARPVAAIVPSCHAHSIASAPKSPTDPEQTK
jgi:hypothetical protein